MADAGFFKGTSAEQDSRFANKQKKLLKQMKFPDNIDVKIDMLKVNLDVIKPWITKRLQELLGIEDDVVIEFVFNQLDDKTPDPKMMQINLTGFLGGSKARLFIGELWKYLTSAQSSPDGIPAELVEMKKRELLKRQEEDDRLREICKREEDSHRQDIKSDIDKSNGRTQIFSSRNENDNIAGYKSRSHYDDDRRNRRRSPLKTRRARESHSPEPRSRNDKKSTRPISKGAESEDDRHRRHRSPSKSPSQSRSPIKSSRKNEKHQQPSPSTDNKPSPEPIKKTKPRSPSSSSSSSSDDHNKTKQRKTNENNNSSSKTKRKSPKKERISSKKNKKQSKRTRSLSASRSSSNSSSSSDSEPEKNKKHKKISDKKKDDHKSRKHNSKSSSKRSNDTKRKSHRDHPDKSITKKSHRNESSKKKKNKDSSPIPLSPKKPRLESQIKIQTPPPPPSKSSDENNSHFQQPIKPNRTERIVVLEDSRTDGIDPRVSVTTKSVHNEEQQKNNHSSEDENEIDLRERLLREKAIKSMRRRQLDTKAPSDRIVYETQ